MSSDKCSSNSRFGYSEEEMGDAFASLLESAEGLPELGLFHAVYREVSCRQGRPDFIALRYASNQKRDDHFHVPGLVAPSIINKLQPKAPRTLDYLLACLEFSPDSIRKTLRQLVEHAIVERMDSGSYRLSVNSLRQLPEMWSFELKLDNPKRAVFQAQQSRAYAERAIIVVPPGQEKNYDRFRETMRRWHIGLATFDMDTAVFRFVRKGRKARALSRTHQLYAFSQLRAGRRPT